MVTSYRKSIRNRYWSFKIEQKVFVLQLTKDGGGVSISERSRLRSFQVEINVSAAVWCLEILQEVVLLEERQPFFRKYRGSVPTVLAEKYSNRRGTFLKLFKLSNGRLQNIIIPRGLSRWGWKRLAVCLDNLVGKHFWNVEGRGRKDGQGEDKLSYDDRRQYVRPKENGLHPSWKKMGETKGKQGEVEGIKLESQRYS